MATAFLFINDMLTYDRNDSVVSYCNSITFQNNGNYTVIINSSITLVQGQFITLGGNTGEMDITKYSWIFKEEELPAGSFKSLLVIRKVYQKNPQAQ